MSCRTYSLPSSDNTDVSVTSIAPEIQAAQTLYSSSTSYYILDFIGEGCFGKVAKCRNLATKETVAVKILKNDTEFLQDTEKEMTMLQMISGLDPARTNIVKFFERFDFMGHTCLAFEMLDQSLFDLLNQREWKPLSLCEIRPIAQQLLEALDALRVVGVLHTDIKPDNIMLVNQQKHPLRVKLIDFGEAIPVSAATVGLEIQPRGFRAPEVTLGLPFSQAIDVWGLGCVLGFLYLADNPFPVECDYQSMKCMLEVLGQPADHMLRTGLYTRFFFNEVDTTDGTRWELKTPEEYAEANGVEPKERKAFFDLPSSLDDLVCIHPEGDAAEFEDRRVFVDLLKGLLHLDGEQRVSPRQALQHCFFTFTHLTHSTDACSYVTTARHMMDICQVDDVHTSSSFGPPNNVTKHPVTTNNLANGEESPYSEDEEGSSADEHESVRSSDDDNHLSEEDEDAQDEENEGWSSDDDKDTWSLDDEDTLSEDDEVDTSSEDDEEDTSSEDDEVDTSSEDDEEDTSYEDGEEDTSSEDDKEDTWSTDEDGDACDEDIDTCSSDGPREPSQVSSSVSTPKVFRRIHKFFRQITTAICCCFRPVTED